MPRSVSDAGRPALEVLLEAVADRSHRRLAAAPSDRMVTAMARLNADMAASAIALDQVATVAPAMIRDAQIATEEISSGRQKKITGFANMTELTNLAAIFAKTRHDGMYAAVCITLRELNAVMHGGGQWSVG